MDQSLTTQITDLLLERERLFVQVWKCESMIRAIVGDEFAFPDPPELPSTARDRRPRRTAAAVGATVRPRGTLRRLRGREDAYRVTLSCDGHAHVSFQNDTAFLRRMLAVDAPSLVVRRIDTVAFRTPDDYDVLETVWQDDSRPSSPAPGSGTEAPDRRS